jgi:hypothetical protein
VAFAGIFSLPLVIQLFVLLSGIAIFSGVGLESYDDNIRNSTRLPDNQEYLISKTDQEPLSFGVFTFANDSETMEVMQYQYSSNDLNHYVIHSIRTPPGSLWLYDAFPMHRKMIIVQSLDNITNAINIGQHYDLDLIVYDIEIWERTPETERNNPPFSISKGAGIVHQAGYRYGIAPDAPTLIDNYMKINWAEIDFLDMQLQRFSQNVSEYSSIAEEITTYVRSKNPNIEIFTQLSFRFTGANDMITVIESVKDIVDGFFIFYDTNSASDSCAYLFFFPQCSPHDELSLVLDRIKTLS